MARLKTLVCSALCFLTLVSTSLVASPNKPVCVAEECSLAKLNTLRSIAARGNEEASFSLGHIFMNPQSGVKTDLENSFYYFNKSAQQGFLPAYRQAAGMLAQGIGTEKDIAEAKRLMKKAADKGVSKTAEEYAVMVFSDTESTDEERNDAIALLKREAQTGMSYLANYMLAVLHIDGQYTNQDFARAAELLAFPASGDYANAKQLLAQLNDGNGTFSTTNLTNNNSDGPALDPNIETITVTTIGVEVASLNEIMLDRMRQKYGQTGSRILGKGCKEGEPNCRIIRDGFMKNQTFWNIGNY